MLEGKCVVLGVTGGIAAYKACEIVSRLTTAAMPKFVGSLVGVLKAAGRIHGSHPQLAKALDFRSINPDTVSSYISKGKRELPATLRFVLAWHPSAR